MGNFRGLVAGLPCLHISLLQVVRANPERSRFPVREEGQVAWLSRLTDLARVRACQQFQYSVNKKM
jgi:hypothetical protein